MNWRLSARRQPNCSDMPGQDGAPCAPASASGLTLIELLVALALAGLLVGIVLMIHSTTLYSTRLQMTEADILAPVEDALQALQNDLLGSLIPGGCTNPFLLFPNTDQTSELRLRLFSARPESAPDWRSYSIEEVTYTLRAEQDGRYALQCQRQPWRAELSAAPLTMARAIIDMQIQLYDGQAWTNTWEGHSRLPQAARVWLLLELPNGTQALTMETLIPAGHRLPPSPMASASP